MLSRISNDRKILNLTLVFLDKQFWVENSKI